MEVEENREKGKKKETIRNGDLFYTDAIYIYIYKYINIINTIYIYYI